jgi:hypothetical protein
MTLSTAIRLPIVALAIAGVVAIFPYSPRAVAQDAPPAAPQAPEAAAPADGVANVDQVFATVNGMPITAGDLLIAAEDYARQSPI